MDRRTIVRGITTGVAAAWVSSALCDGQNAAPAHPGPRLRVGDTELEVEFSGATPDLAQSDLLAWVKQSATAVAQYFGRFPVPEARLSLVVRDGRKGVSGGRTWGEPVAHSRISIGQHTNVTDLKHDWVLTHEFVHYGFPDMPERNHWIEEGLATYVEPIARVAAATQDAPTAWFEMLRDMPQGEPKDGDEGLDRTHTWARTYWGGAIFCLLADVAIRKDTGHRKGLRDALRGIVAEGGNIEVQWPIERALAAGDKAVGGRVLIALYEQMAAKPVTVDLIALWKQLGVARQRDTVVFDDDAPLAAVRKAILS